MGLILGCSDMQLNCTLRNARLRLGCGSLGLAGCGLELTCAMEPGHFEAVRIELSVDFARNNLRHAGLAFGCAGLGFRCAHFDTCSTWLGFSCAR